MELHIHHLIPFSNIDSLSISVNNSNFLTLLQLFFKAASYTNLAAVRNFRGSNL